MRNFKDEIARLVEDALGELQDLVNDMQREHDVDVEKAEEEGITKGYSQCEEDNKKTTTS